MTGFIQNRDRKSASRQLKKPFPDIVAFNALVMSFILNNPLGCTPYRSARKNHPPVEKVREMYTAKFAYVDAEGNRTGMSLDRYDTVDGYTYGIAAVLSNMANVAAHRGRVRHMPEADLFSVTLKCHDPHDEFYFVSFARNRFTISSYESNEIRAKAGAWSDTIPALA